MATCTVYHNSPGKGPGFLSAQTALAEINQAQPAWNVTLDHNADRSLYTTQVAGVSGAQLQAVVEPEFSNSGYLFSNTN